LTSDEEPVGGWLVLRHWTKGRSGDFWGPDDYDVIWNGRDVGRIFKPGAAVPEDRPWEWTIIGGVAKPRGSRSYGFAATR
jgi:hypothetical protein